MRGMDRTTGKLLEGRAHIVQSIKLILSTPINTRVMRPEFGSEVPNLISAPMDDANRLRLYAAATEAINRWEPRIEITNISVVDQSADGAIYIRIEGRYEADDFSIPSLKVGVAMRDDTFWIEALEVVDPALDDKVPLADADDGFKDKAALLSKILELVPGASFTIYTDGTLSGTGEKDDVLRVAIPLTPEEKTKIASIETGAQVNPKHVIKASFLDGDTGANGSNLDAADLGLYTGTTQLQTGNVTAADTIYVPRQAAPFNRDLADAGNPPSIFDDVSLEPLLDDIVTNGGNVVLQMSQYGKSTILMVRADTIAEVKSGNTLLGWKLTNLTWHGSYTPASYGVSWNVVASYQGAPPFIGDVIGYQAPRVVGVRRENKTALTWTASTSWNNVLTLSATPPDTAQIRIRGVLYAARQQGGQNLLVGAIRRKVGTGGNTGVYGSGDYTLYGEQAQFAQSQAWLDWVVAPMDFDYLFENPGDGSEVVKFNVGLFAAQQADPIVFEAESLYLNRAQNLPAQGYPDAETRWTSWAEMTWEDTSGSIGITTVTTRDSV